MMYVSLISCVCFFPYVSSSRLFYAFGTEGLSYMQVRKGPNKVGFMGIRQPLVDAAKLLTKEILKPIFSNYFLYLGVPVLSFSLALLLWYLYPGCLGYLKWGVLFVWLCVCPDWMFIGLY